jgi:hypothetical protein
MKYIYKIKETTLFIDRVSGKKIVSSSPSSNYNMGLTIMEPEPSSYQLDSKRFSL